MGNNKPIKVSERSTKTDYTSELKRIEELVNQARNDNKEIVVVMGPGFVGAVMDIMRPAT